VAPDSAFVRYLGCDPRSTRRKPVAPPRPRWRVDLLHGKCVRRRLARVGCGRRSLSRA